MGAKAVLDDIAPPLLTCDAVVAEACYLSAAVIRLIEPGQVASPFRLEPEAASIRKLLEKYAGIPMDLADACLVRMSEQYSELVF